MAAYIASNDQSILPKTFEDAKLAKTQRITHGDILALGHKIFQKNNANQREIFNEEIIKMKNELLKKAEEEKLAMLQEASRKGEEERKKVLEEAKHEQERLVKEEAKRVKEVMKQIVTARVEQEHREGEQRLQIALNKKREEFDREKAEAVLKARQMEQDKAKQMRNELMKQHEDDMAKMNRKAEVEKEGALEKLRALMISEKDLAIQKTRSEAEKEGERKRLDLCKIHDGEINKKMEEKNQLQEKIENLLAEVQLEKASHSKTSERLEFVIKSFQGFIDCQPGFSKGQADFILKDFLQESIDK